mmetsp:Transcript_21519/g.59616  ORF Transcript_21519/g.59616 Transcript_21519/m.59616 type:complete len:80 (+) Transcript_21519:2505-2744(+)
MLLLNKKRALHDMVTDDCLVYVILARGPCCSSLYRPNISICPEKNAVQDLVEGETFLSNTHPLSPAGSLLDLIKQYSLL